MKKFLQLMGWLGHSMLSPAQRVVLVMLVNGSWAREIAHSREVSRQQSYRLIDNALGGLANQLRATNNADTIAVLADRLAEVFPARAMVRVGHFRLLRPYPPDDLCNLALSTRALNTLHHAEIYTISVLLRWSPGELRKLGGVGRKVLRSVVHALSACDLELSARVQIK